MCIMMSTNKKYSKYSIKPIAITNADLKNANNCNTLRQ